MCKNKWLRPAELSYATKKSFCLQVPQDMEAKTILRWSHKSPLRPGRFEGSKNIAWPAMTPNLHLVAFFFLTRKDSEYGSNLVWQGLRCCRVRAEKELKCHEGFSTICLWGICRCCPRSIALDDR